MSDIPHLGLGAALARAASDGLAGAYCAAADGGKLPFADATFHRVINLFTSFGHYLG